MVKSKSSSIHNAIKQLSTHVLQRYIAALLDAKYKDPMDWRKTVLQIAQSRQEDYRFDYRPIIEKIDEVGLSDYSVYDFDSTKLMVIVKHMMRDQLGITIPANIFYLAKQVGQIKNKDSHESTNEEIASTVQWSENSLQTIQDFINAAAKDSNIPGSDRELFQIECSVELDETREEIKALSDEDFEKEREIRRQIEKDAEDVCSSQNPDSVYFKKLEKWMNESFSSDSWAKLKYVYMFKREVTEKGYIKASPWVAQEFFEGHFEETDYEKAAYYYGLQDVTALIPQDQLNLASIYMNGLSSLGDKSDAKKIIDSVRKRGQTTKHAFDVIEHSENGYVFYQVRRTQ